MRRFQPESLPVPQLGKDWPFCQIGGKLIPIQVQEAPGVYRQVHQLPGWRLTNESIPVPPPDRPEANALLEKLVRVDAG